MTPVAPPAKTAAPMPSREQFTDLRRALVDGPAYANMPKGASPQDSMKPADGFAKMAQGA